MYIVIAAGGTGGHFYPGLAVAKALIREGNTVSFLVRRKDYVIPLLEREAIPFRTISAAGMVRRLSAKNILMPVKLFIGFVQSFLSLQKKRPDLVLVMGGYLSVPAALAARLAMIPVVLHEQNIKPGLANRILSVLAKKVAVSFQESERYFKGLAVTTGNPIRPEFKTLPTREDALRSWALDPGKKTILVFGGSLGSQSLNKFVLEALAKIEEHALQFQIIHFTGPSDEARVKEAYEKLKFQSHVEGYCHDMTRAYAACDLVVSRSGASTVSELMAVKKPALLVPYPYATGGHQLANAQVLQQAGVANVAEEKNLRRGEMKNHLKRFMIDPHVFERMRAAYDRFNGSPFQSAEKILNVLESVVKKPVVNCWFV